VSEQSVTSDSMHNRLFWSVFIHKICLHEYAYDYGQLWCRLELRILTINLAINH